MKHGAGLHVILDGYVKDPNVFNGPALKEAFEKLADALEMKIIMGPDFLEVELDPTKLQSDVFQDLMGCAVFAQS